MASYHITKQQSSMSQPLSKFGKTFISYGSYHNNIVNKWIHIICVPIIAATLVSAVSFIPISFQLAGLTFGAAEIGLAAVLVYYASINIGFALGMAVLMVGMAFGWQKIFQGMEQAAFLKWVVATHIVAWIFQFIGHGVFQKRKPALLDNLTQILNAPLFVVVEIFDMLGIRSAQMEQWNAQIEKNVAELRKKE